MRSPEIVRSTTIRMLLVLLMSMSLGVGCTAMNPQTAARQQATTYHHRSYDQLSAGEKMELEQHLGSQSNAAWRTNAQVASGLGRLMQGAGILIRGIR